MGGDALLVVLKTQQAHSAAKEVSKGSCTSSTCGQKGITQIHAGPNKPLHTFVWQSEQEGQLPDCPCGLQTTTVAIPRMLRTFQAKACH